MVTHVGGPPYEMAECWMAEPAHAYCRTDRQRSQCVQPMPINDSLFLLAEARQTPMHVGGLLLLEPPAGSGPGWLAEQYRAALEHTDVDPRLARRPSRMAGAGPWEWERDEHIDLEYHVRHSALPHPGRVRELLTLVGRLHGTLLDRSRPLWETHFIEGLADGRVAAYTKMHHAMIDGVAAMRLLERSLSRDADSMPKPAVWAPDPRRRQQRPGDATSTGRLGRAASAVGDAVQGAVGGVRALTGASEATLRQAVRSFQEQAAAMPYQAPRSPLNVSITGARRFAADDWPLQRLDAVKAATGATLNDVLMAMCAGALRRYLLDLDQLPDDPLVAMVPVSLREADDESVSNAVGVVLCNLGTHLADPEERFAWIQRSMDRGKLTLKGLTPTAAMLVSALTFAPLALGPLFRFEPFRKPPFNLVISNVPGPRQQLYWNGARLLGNYPLSIPSHGQAVNITATTVNGDLDIGITGDRNALPHLQDLLDHLEESLVELEGVAGVG